VCANRFQMRGSNANAIVTPNTSHHRVTIRVLLSFVIVLQCYAPQTKIRAGRTNIRERIVSYVASHVFDHNPSNGRMRKLTIRPRRFILSMFGGRTSVLGGLSLTRLVQSSATSPPFLDNLHFEHLDKYSNLDLWLTILSKCSKWRLSKRRGTSCRRLGSCHHHQNKKWRNFAPTT